MNVIEKPGQPSAPSADTATPTVDLAPGGNAELAALAERFKQLLAGATHPAANLDAKSTPAALLPSSNSDQGHVWSSSEEAPIFRRPDFPSRHEAVLDQPPAPRMPPASDLNGASDESAPAIVSRVATEPSELPLSPRQGPAPLEETDPMLSPETPGAAMLQSFLSQSSMINGPAPVAPAARVQSLESVVAETVSRVLVSDPLHDGRREVRIEFARDVLPDTEVRLWRDAGRLHVEFISAPAVAEQGLKEALPRLGEVIQQRHAETTAPIVTLRLHDLDAGTHSGDGRSRQRYHRPDESEELA